MKHFLCQGSRDISVDIMTRLHVRRARIRVSISGKAEESYRLWAPLSLLFSRYLGFLGRDSSVGIATQYRLDVPGIDSRCVARFSAPVQTGLGTYPASYIRGSGSFPGVKRPGRGFDHPSHLAPRLKKE